MKGAAFLVLVFLGACDALCAEAPAPVFPVPVRPLGFELGAPLAPVSVTGLDVIAPDGRSLSPPLRLREDGTYILRLFVKYADASGSQPVTLSAALDSGGPVRETASPTLDRTPAGTVQTLELPLRFEPAQGSGESELRIGATRSGETPPGAVRFWPLAVLPVFVEPVPAPCALDAHRVKEVFGDRAVLLDARFRLGKGAFLELPVPPALAGVAIRAVGVVSSVAWLPRQDRDKPGLVVATVSAQFSDGEDTVPLRLGAETLQVDHESFGKSRASADGHTRVFSEWTQGEAEKRQTRRNYAAVCPLGSSRPVQRILVKRADTAAVVQVDGILLVPAE